MKTETEIRLEGMQALINALGLVDAEQFLATVSRDKLNYTEWRRNGLPNLSIDMIAKYSNELASRIEGRN